LPITPLEAVDKAVTSRRMIDGSNKPAGCAIGSKILTIYVKISAHIVIKRTPVGADGSIHSSAPEMQYEILL
jgi:hypothetical protein